MRVANREQTPGGWMVDVEVPNAYTDGTSRFERVFVSRDSAPGGTAAEVLDAINDAMTNDPAAQAIGQDVTAAQATKAVWEARITSRFDRWQMWKTIRVEAQARSLPAAAVTARAVAVRLSRTDWVTMHPARARRAERQQLAAERRPSTRVARVVA